MRLNKTAKIASMVLILCAATGSASAQCGDFFEENDSCAQAPLISTGFWTGLRVDQADVDYYHVSLPPGNELQVALGFQHNSGDIDLRLMDNDCSSVLVSSLSTTDNEYISWTNNSGGWRDVYVLVTLYAPNPDIWCPLYDMSTSVIDHLGCGPEELMEDNDTCATAHGVIVPMYALFFAVYSGDDDYFRVTVPAGEALYAGLGFSHATADVDLAIYSADCSTLLESSTSTTDDEECNWKNLSSWDQDVVVRVYLYNGACNNYNMTLETYDALCWGDDYLEENDSCAAAATIAPGTTATLIAGNADDDWFRIGVPAGHSLSVDALFSHVEGDIDIVLYDVCGGQPVAISNSVTDDEHVAALNGSGATRDYFLWVFVYDYGNGLDCNLYDLVVQINSSQPGSNYCVSHPNSTGMAAEIGATGTNSVSANDLVLTAGPLPPNQFGVFFYGAGPTQVPFGNHGFRCVTTPVIRLQRYNSGPAGVIQHALDVTSPPQAWGLITPGSTWYFQAWYRDPGFGFNLTDGLAVTFTP